MNESELKYWLALQQIPGVGTSTAIVLLAHFKNPENIFSAAEAELKQCVRMPEKALSYMRQPDWNSFDAVWRWLEQPHHAIITLADESMGLLHEIADPPVLLFINGDSTLLTKKQIAIVGSRNPTASGKIHATDFARALAQGGFAVNSGMAAGIDAAAHQGALEAGGATIAVLGTGIDRVYPAAHKKLAHQIAEQGLIISEFPLATPPLKGNFPRRNRLISGLSQGTLVVEASLKSGSLITARLAVEQGREVFAVPGSINNALATGCHELIRQGAILVQDSADIFEEYGLQTTLDAENRPDQNIDDELLSTEQTIVIKHLGFDPVSVDELIERSGLTAEKVSSILLALEMSGHVISTAGTYIRTR